MRFPIRIDTVWAPFVLVGGATRNNSYVEVDGGEVAFNYGLLFRHRIPLEDIESVQRRSWPIWYGIGWRTNFVDMVGLIGSYEGVVEVRLRNRKRYWAVLGAQRIAVSLEDPDAFIETIERARGASEPEPEPKPKTRRKSRSKKVAEE